MDTSLSPSQAENAARLQRIANKYFQHAEMEELKEKTGMQVHVYFDTYYVFAMIQGYWELQIGRHKTDENKFSDDAFLVKALAFLGYIDNIKIFLPHVAELSEQLQKSYLLPADDLSENEINAFLDEIKLQKLSELKILADQNKLKQYLLEMAPNAEIIFKANYILSELYWNKRSNRLFHGTNEKKPIIAYDSQRFNPMSLLELNLFKKIEAAISSGDRANLTINNFRDTIALCMFKEKIPDRNDNPQILPFFYVSHDIYSKLTDEIFKEFSYTPKKNGRRIYLIKDAEYFIIEAIFSQEKNAGEPISEHKGAFDKLKDIKRSFDLYRNIDIPFPIEEIKPLINKWDKYRTYEFFQLIWDDEKGGIVPLNKYITDLFEYNFLANDNRFSPMLERERKSIKLSFDTQARDFGFLEDVWAAVSKIKGELKTRCNNAADQFDVKRVDFFRDEGMTRFSLPHNTAEACDKLWEGFLTSHQHNDRDDHYLKVEVTKLLYNGFLKDPKQIDYDKILVAISILYVFRRNEIIIRIIERLQFPYANRYQIALIHAASMYKFAKRPGYLERIDKVILDIENCPDFEKNYKFWIGLGYVKFNVWKTLTTPTKSEHSDPEDFYRRKYLKDGIKLTKKAYDFLQKNLKTGPDEDYRMVKYYYTLNNYIYYTVESQVSSHILDDNFYRQFVTALQTCQANDQYRQNRFSDTIARYYLAIGRLNKVDSDKIYHLSRANYYIDDAINTAVLRDERFDDLKSEIEFELQSVNARIKKQKEFGNDIRFEQ